MDKSLDTVKEEHKATKELIGKMAEAMTKQGWIGGAVQDHPTLLRLTSLPFQLA